MSDSSTDFCSAWLPEPGPRRGLIKPELKRDGAFLARYEDRVLFYDVFWSASGDRIIAHGPPVIGFEDAWREAAFHALPSGQRLRAQTHNSNLVQLLSFEAPADTKTISITLAGQTFEVAVRSNDSAYFAGSNLIFTVSKNNDLQWIEDWARFHAVNQKADAVLLYDNGSDRYAPQDITERLNQIPGITRVRVVSAPFRYPIEDKAHGEHVFWAHFLQPNLIVNMFRRFGQQARAILNSDIDELFVPLSDTNVFDAAVRSRSGTVYYRGVWVSPIPDRVSSSGRYRHKDFTGLEAGQTYWKGPTTKWAVAPNRRWLNKLESHPYPHDFKNRPMLTRGKPKNAFMAHFRAISTSWKTDRSVVAGDASLLERDPALTRALERAFG